MFHQPTLEHAVRARLATLPNVSARLGQSLAGYEASGAGVVATIKGEEGDYTVSAKREDKTYSKDFSVKAGPPEDIQVITSAS